ncbi:MAG: NAD(P)-dependent oxidoreductase [Flavobacteriales bacterium TMED235]|nr:MAG: NAD(P)-dependent oxidoreductase [Flavobacteriales bacterium TMED235]|tara:strand:- start:93 stop:1034 length:942 start_codon:yes stop_codon:yes gene_type:complete
MKKKFKILITGGAGYIGSMLATRLLDLGNKITVIDILEYDTRSLNHLYLNKNFTFIKKDVRDKLFIKKIVKKFDFVIPLAGLVGAPLCEKRKKDAKEINLQAVKDLVSFLSKKQKIIFTNSNSGYGIGSKQKFCDEKSPLNPISLYGRTKVDAEKIVMKFNNSISFRLATVFGYSYRMRTDLLLNNLVLLSMRDGKLDIFESNFRRNFIHVSDVCDGIIFAIYNFNRLKSNVYNLGMSKANITKFEMVKKIKKYIKNLEINKIQNKKDPDKRDYFVSNKKIEKKGFKATIDIDEGILELINVYKSHKDFINNY